MKIRDCNATSVVCIYIHATSKIIISKKKVLLDKLIDTIKKGFYPMKSRRLRMRNFKIFEKVKSFETGLLLFPGFRFSIEPMISTALSLPQHEFINTKYVRPSIPLFFLALGEKWVCGKKQTNRSRTSFFHISKSQIFQISVFSFFRFGERASGERRRGEEEKRRMDGWMDGWMGIYMCTSLHETKTGGKNGGGASGE